MDDDEMKPALEDSGTLSGSQIEIKAAKTSFSETKARLDMRQTTHLLLSSVGRHLQSFCHSSLYSRQ